MTEFALANLSVLEVSRLSDLEAVIDQGRQTFIEVGNALLEIRESRLYRESHGTFEDYCLERWGWTPQHGGRLMKAAAVARALEPIGSIPATESQARELAPLLESPEDLRDAWQEANENGKATAATVREAVERRLPEPRLTGTRPLDPEVMERHQRDTAVEVLDRSVYALEANISDIPIHLDWILETRDLAGPYGVLTAERLRKASDYCAAFAAELRKRGI